jgi:hypothetical protein
MLDEKFVFENALRVKYRGFLRELHKKYKKTDSVEELEVKLLEVGKKVNFKKFQLLSSELREYLKDIGFSYNPNETNFQIPIKIKATDYGETKRNRKTYDEYGFQVGTRRSYTARLLCKDWYSRQELIQAVHERFGDITRSAHNIDNTLTLLRQRDLNLAAKLINDVKHFKLLKTEEEKKKEGATWT